jgi:hypothetical protein
MLLLIYKNGTTQFRQDDNRRRDRLPAFTEDEIVVKHEDTLTKGQMISKQKQFTVKHSFEFVDEVNGYLIYKEVE